MAHGFCSRIIRNIMNKSLSLLELNSLVSELIETVMSRSYWVSAEVSEARENRGHLYLELIQKDDRANTPVARASAKCWRSSWSLIAPYFERTAGVKIRAGLHLLLQVHPQFHPQYGFSWIIDDINPEYTMGDMMRKRQEIIRQLKTEGVFDLQKELTLPIFSQRIAVISSSTAAGYGDFCNQLKKNEYALDFHTELFAAIMQGEGVGKSIISALNSINDRCDEFDCVVIIRGGGATADLSGFDTLDLAENVANFPLPIITGIGHERDESILDMISYKRVKTPTAAATFLIDHLLRVLTFIENARDDIRKLVQIRLQQEEIKLQRLSTNIPVLFSMVKTRYEMTLEAILRKLLQDMSKALSDETMILEKATARLLPAIERKRLQQVHHLELLTQRANAMNPNRMLRLGYSITYGKNGLLRDASSVLPGEELTTILENGKIVSVVK